MKGKRKPPEIVFCGGKPTAVILNIDEYQEMLERLDDIKDLKSLAEMRKKSLKFRKLDDFLKAHPAGVGRIKRSGSDIPLDVAY